MRILSVHNHYKLRSGEEESRDLETAILRERGHQVDTYEESNAGLNPKAVPLKLLIRTVWSWSAYRKMRQRLRAKSYDVVHVHNFFPQISPSVYYAAKAENVPVVQTLQNFRLLCPSGFLFRDGQVCEQCIDKSFAWSSLVHACYRNNRFATVPVATMLAFHRMIGTWQNQVNRYIALTEYDRQKFIQGGLPADKIAVKPNFVYPDPLPGAGTGNYAIFVGRLSPEKGVDTLLSAWRLLGDKIRLKIVGDGPLAEEVAIAAAQMPQVEWLGFKPMQEIYPLIGEAKCLLFPSKWNETFSRVAAEALAKGTPVIAAAGVSDMAGLIAPGKTGLHFAPGDAEGLARQVQWMIEHPEKLAEMRKQARKAYIEQYAGPQNYEQLMDVYRRVIGGPTHRAVEQISIEAQA